ncbi:MAG: peptidyl-tRNA hydrolase, PTH1 family [Microgenomates group bacterium Gr01-1014_7]|nr:MAG: peptidyl-tRNA hydrolase, PTH1 family [Microgenomates group bacterium Gr01-1014_7]
MKIIVGLGNPEDKYKSVRHNLGFMAVDKLVSSIKYEVLWEDNKKFKSQIARVSPELLVAKPQTYMNNSGMAVKLLADYYKVSPADIVIIYDELDLPLGKIKVRLGGAAAGHHGVESIIDALGTDQFIRVRLGIGNLRTQSSEHKHAHVNAEKFVLEPFMHSEKAQVKHMIKQAIKLLHKIITTGKLN